MVRRDISIVDVRKRSDPCTKYRFIQSWNSGRNVLLPLNSRFLLLLDVCQCSPEVKYFRNKIDAVKPFFPHHQVHIRLGISHE